VQSQIRLRSVFRRMPPVKLLSDDEHTQRLQLMGAAMFTSLEMNRMISLVPLQDREAFFAGVGAYKQITGLLGAASR
jgi:hypothetical protein